MADPYAPVNFKDRPARRPPDHPPIARLRRLGLSRDLADEMQRRWREMSDGEKFEALDAIENLTDDELREGLVEMREEMHEALQRPAEHVTGEDAELAAVDVDQVPDDTVPAVLEWVGEDRARAAAALLAEQRRHEQPRKTLVDPLESLLA
jgi:hypothetical protein